MTLNPYRPLVPDVKKIAVLRANALGDFIFALPALEALRASYPAAEIVLLGLDWHVGFLKGRPSPVDRVVAVPPDWAGQLNAHGKDEPPELRAFFDRMACERFDIAVQLHGGGQDSNRFVQRLRARHTAGLRTPEAAPLDRWVPYNYYQPEVVRFLEVVALIGARTDAIEPRVAVTERDLEEAYQVVPETGEPLVVLHPGASDPRRHWPVERFAAVGDALAATGAQVVVTGTRPEADLTSAVVTGMRANALDLCGRLSLNGLTGLLARSSVVVTNDSGPLHLAAAVGTKTVAIYWCGNLITAGLLTRSHHRPLISWTLLCPVCGLDCTRHNCEHRESFVADVPTDEVLAAALELLGEP